jgi:hypothetical protein
LWWPPCAYQIGWVVNQMACYSKTRGSLMCSIRNDGQRSFSRWAPWTGVESFPGRRVGQPLNGTPLDWGLTATFRGFPCGVGFAGSVTWCNDYWTPDRIWINDGHGHTPRRLTAGDPSYAQRQLFHGRGFAVVEPFGDILTSWLSTIASVVESPVTQTPNAGPKNPDGLASRAIDNRPANHAQTPSSLNRADGTRR